MYDNAKFWDGSESYLGDQFAARARGSSALAMFERSLLDALDTFAKTDRVANDWVADIRSLLADKRLGDPDGEQRLARLLEAAREAIYPASARLLRELQGANEVGGDDMLRSIDRGAVRRLDEEAVTDAESRTFRDDLLARLNEAGAKRSSTWAASVYEIYGEALVLQELRSRAPDGMTITKVPETSVSSPDLKCVWSRSSGDPLIFYIEVKSLGVVGGGAKLNQDREQAFEGALELERQLSQGKKSATVIRTIAPFRKAGSDPDYDPRSLRGMVERTGTKIAGAFGSKQFADGPTFAFANLLRLAHLHHGPRALSRIITGERGKMNGAWWTLAYGEQGTRMLREPEFEGATGDDGVLARTGFLIDPAVDLPTAGLMLLFDEGSRRRIVGLKARFQPQFPGWDDAAARAVLTCLCDAWNDSADSRKQKAAWD